MKIISIPDAHSRIKAPRFRIDNYLGTFLRKIRFVMDLAEDEKAVTCWPGDITDSSKAPYSLLVAMFGLLYEYHKIIKLVCPGQHDLRYHSLKTFDNTPLAALCASGMMTLLEERTIINDEENERVVVFYGAGWGQDVPEITTPMSFNVLVTHRMVTKDGPLWPGHEDYILAEDLLKELDFDLILSGDNHQPFVKRLGDKVLINGGSLMRQNSDQAKHKPRAYIYDTETRKVRKVFIPIKPAVEVFDIAGIQQRKDKQDDMKMNSFISGRKVKSSIKPDFTKTLFNLAKQAQASESVVDLLEDFIEEADNG